ncbi:MULTISPECIES: hypothetical protein [unclassified Bradyrhizobium]|uniref:hypothetical protein n=1 Tax=unclassified Bradyrhizobium TaxID=2631580 RepID=UPI0028E8B3C2|nr:MULTISPECIES: hypothetical protein [unclassified Bradyrhizobium]
MLRVVMRQLWVLAVLLAIPADTLAETAAQKTQNDCSLRAYKEYLADSLKLSAQDDAATSIVGVVGKRRLMEMYCVQFVQCLNTPQLVQGAMFSRCLDDEDADRLSAKNEDTHTDEIGWIVAGLVALGAFFIGRHVRTS